MGWPYVVLIAVLVGTPVLVATIAVLMDRIELLAVRCRPRPVAKVAVHRPYVRPPGMPAPPPLPTERTRTSAAGNAGRSVLAARKPLSPLPARPSATLAARAPLPVRPPKA